MQNYFFSVELFINQDIKIIFWLGNIDRHIYALTENFDWYRFAIILVVQKESKCLSNKSQFVGNESERYSRRVVTFNII